MQFQYTKTLKQFSRSNRKSQTDAEKTLWLKLRNKQLNGYKFRRQFPLLHYILDFYCLDKKLAIELDGSQHFENQFYDSQRTQDLQELGIKVIRFLDNEVLQNLGGVLEKILTELNKTSSYPSPIRRRDEGT